jgi:hypothetical protein
VRKADGNVDSDINALFADVPIANGRMLLEVVNGITVGRSMGGRRNGFFTGLLAGVSGRQQRGTNAALAVLAEGQYGLAAWLTELTSGTAQTNLALDRSVRQIRQLRAALERVTERSEQLTGQLREVVELQIEQFDHLDERVTELELWRAAEDEYNRLFATWASGERYPRLPWVFRVVLLAREMAGGPCGDWEHRNGERKYRDRLAHQVRADPGTRQAIDGLTTIRHLLDASIAELDGEEPMLMIAELLDAGLAPGLALPRRPLAATIVAALELSSLPAPVRPPRPAELAISLVRRQLGELEGATDRDSLVTQLVDEQADAASEYRIITAGKS